MTMLQGLVNSLHAGLPATPTEAPKQAQQMEEEGQQTMEQIEMPQPEVELAQDKGETDKQGSTPTKRVAGNSPEQAKKPASKRGKGKRS